MYHIGILAVIFDADFSLEAIVFGNCMLLDIILSHYILINILNICVLLDFTLNSAWPP